MAKPPGEFSFWGTDPEGGYDALQMRRQIAMQMLSQKKGYPKNMGEGLASVGDSLGDAFMMRQLQRQAIAEKAAGTSAAAKIYGGGAAAPVASIESRPISPVASADPSTILAADDPNAPNIEDPTTPDERATATASINAGEPPVLGDVPVADFKAPAYLKDVIARNEQNPAMRGYYGTMAGKEAQSPTEVSSTGATGPFQFLRSTGQQYGLNGRGFDNRTDPEASMKAMQAFTSDNIKTLTAALGRPPTLPELALAHQQGAGTAAKMLSGTGNASANNLAVNNVAPGSSPQAAADKIMGYYGLPNTPVPSRDAVTAALVAQQPQQQPLQAADATAEKRFNDVIGMQQGPTGGYAYPAVASRGDIANDAPPVGLTGGPGNQIGQAVGDTVQQREQVIKTLNDQRQDTAPVVPQPNPTLAGATTSISPVTAATATSPVEAANNRPIVLPDVKPQSAGTQMAQAPEYVMQRPVPPEPPSVPQMSPRETQARAALAGPNGDNPDLQRAAKAAIEEEQAKSQFAAQRAITVYNAQVQHYQTMDTKYQDWLASREKNRLELQKTQAEVGALPEKLTDEAAKRKQDAVKAAADLEKVQQEVAAGKHVIVDGRLMIPDKAAPTGWRDVTPDPSGTSPGGPPNVKMTAEQQKSQMFHSWTSLAEEQMRGKDKLLADGLQQELAGKTPFIGNKIQNEDYRRVRGAAERFIQGFLRDISGAVVSPEEIVKHQNTFMPRYGDDDKTIADKREARQNIISGLYAGAGPGRAISDWETNQRAEHRAKTDTKLSEEMKDVPKVQGKVYRDTDTGKRRVWNGERWEEY